MSDYLSGQRILIVYRQGDADSESFASEAASMLSVPSSHKLALPCSGSETLGNYATFQTEIETPLNQWLADNPTIEAEITCILLGHGVGGYFEDDGRKVSATARLGNIGSAFVGATLNPLAGSTARLTKATLGPGRYMCVRIDAGTLAQSEAILGAMASPLYLDNSANSAESLRTGSACQAALSAGDMGTAGMSASPGQDERIDSRAFYAMLKLGGTFAEAAFVSVSHFDSQAVSAGNPLGSLGGQAGRYIYAGPGSPGQIDWQSPVGWAPASREMIKVNLPLSPGQKYAIGARAVSAPGTEEHNTHVVCFAEVNHATELQPAPLPRPTAITAQRLGAELVRIGFTCQAKPGYATPAAFDLLGDSGQGNIDEENPLASITATDPSQAEFVADITSVTFPAKFAVRPRLGDQPGPTSDIVELAQARQPTPPIGL